MAEDKPTYLEILAKQDAWNRRHLMSLFSLVGVPESYADFGCGTGTMVKLAHSIGVEAVGFDQHDYEAPWYKEQDLTMKMKPQRAYQLVTCIEVAEHIPQSYDGLFLDNIVMHVQKGNGVLVFTAAHPGQEGEGHVNTRPATYWREQLHKRGLAYQIELTSRLSLLWNSINSPLYWLAANLQLFSG